MTRAAGRPALASLSSLAPRGRSRRTVAKRVLGAYIVVMTAFAVASGWSVLAQKQAAEQAQLMRIGYLPLSLALRDLVAKQDTWNTQLNDVTSALNPADKGVWFDTALRIGRPKMFGELRAAISRAFVMSPTHAESIGAELLRETSDIELFLADDSEPIAGLFAALDANQHAKAEQLRDALVRRGSEGKKRLSLLETRVQKKLDELLDEAHARERLAIRILVALASLTLLVGAVMALYARRVLKPLAAVTERAKAVAHGDLTPHPVVASADEIGELAATFEGMVKAIARANEQVLITERLATIGKMAAHVTHEIRNPLSSIALNLELLADEIETQKTEARSLLRAIANEVDRLNALSEQYLSVARQREPHPEVEDLGQVVRDACEFMRRDIERHGVQLELHIAERLPLLKVDEAQIKQALFNLLRNAQEAMPNGGKLTVRVTEADQTLSITIDDEGGGIDEATRERLFEPFFTTKGHGTGLGLAVTHQIIEAHAGRIRCEARASGGTRMCIELPAPAGVDRALAAG